MSMTDVCIIGGGPAGLAAALAARHRGLRVVLADGARQPIDKACGEGLMPDTRFAAEALGLRLPPSAGVEFRGVRFLGERCSVHGNFPAGRGLGLRRTVLHEHLVAAAEQAGVDLRWGTPVTSLHQLPARWIIGADGVNSRVRHWAGLDSYRRNSARYAHRRHFAIQPWSEYVEVYWGAACQIYITPVTPHEICAAVISREPQLRLEAALHRCSPLLAARLAGAETTSRERGAVTMTRQLRAVAGGNVALLGDASGSVDAITGEGIGLSFKQAIALADAIVRGDLQPYNALHPRLSFRPRMMANLMLLMDRGRNIREGALGALSSMPAVFQKLLEVHVGA